MRPDVRPAASLVAKRLPSPEMRALGSARGCWKVALRGLRGQQGDEGLAVMCRACGCAGVHECGSGTALCRIDWQAHTSSNKDFLFILFHFFLRARLPLKKATPSVVTPSYPSPFTSQSMSDPQAPQTPCPFPWHVPAWPQEPGRPSAFTWLPMGFASAREPAAPGCQNASPGFLPFPSSSHSAHKLLQKKHPRVSLPLSAPSSLSCGAGRTDGDGSAPAEAPAALASLPPPHHPNHCYFLWAPAPDSSPLSSPPRKVTFG